PSRLAELVPHEQTRRLGGTAEPPRIARRPGCALPRGRLVAEMAPARAGPFVRLRAEQRGGRLAASGRSGEPAAGPHEPPPVERRGVARRAAGRRRANGPYRRPARA